MAVIGIVPPSPTLPTLSGALAVASASTCTALAAGPNLSGGAATGYVAVMVAP